MPTRRKSNVIYIQNDDQPSKFLLDLKRKTSHPEIVKTTAISGIDKTTKPLSAAALNRTDKPFLSVHHSNLKRLAFYPVVKTILVFLKSLFVVLYKTSYFFSRAPILFLKAIHMPISALKIRLERRKLSVMPTPPPDEEIYKVFNHKVPLTPKKSFPAVMLDRRITSSETFPATIRVSSNPPADKKIKIKLGLNSLAESANDLFKTLIPRPKWAYAKASFYFGAILLILILPLQVMVVYQGLSDFKGRVLGTAEAGFADLSNGAVEAGKLDFANASDNFDQASKNFYDAEGQIKALANLFSLLSPIIPNQNIKMAAQADVLLRAGAVVSELGKETTASLDVFSGDTKPRLKQIVNNFAEHSEKMNELAKELESLIKQVDPKALPAEYQPIFVSLSEKSGLLTQNINQLSELIKAAQIFFGVDYSRRYLFVFQNNSELRASGGFIGSFARIDFVDGELASIYAPGGGSYDTEGGLTERYAAPEPLSLVNPLWHFWDANWWPDWPTTAKKLAWFYEKSDEPTVDGVISITPTAFEKMLAIIGPIDMTEKYGKIIDAENFWPVVQELAEQKPDKTNAPKQIIRDLLDKIILETPKTLDKDKFMDLAAAVDSSFREKHILFYSTNSEMQSTAVRLGWDGSMSDASYDYLMVVNSNIGGAKTDQKINEDIHLTTEIGLDGSIYNNLKIIRTHNGIKNEPFFGVRNVNWMRIYVPAGSELVTVRGFVKPDEKYFQAPAADWEYDPDVLLTEGKAYVDMESGTKIYNENNKTVFANWSMIDPGETATIYLKYKLPFNIYDQTATGRIDRILDLLEPYSQTMLPFSLLAQKQPGSIGSRFFYQLKIADSLIVQKNYPADFATDSDVIRSATDLKTDKYFAFIFSKNTYGK